MASIPKSPAFKDNELLINYHDAVIYGWELKLIERRNEWLNDSCINFFFTHLQQQQQQQDKSSCPTAPCFLFMDPSVVSFWMHLCTDQDEIDDFVKSTKFPGKESERGGTVFIAVNDKMSSSGNNCWQDSGNGNHWSLLVVEVVVSGERANTNDDKDSSTRNLRFWHFDSIRNSGNIRAAEEIAAKLCLHVYPDASIIRSSPSLAGDVRKGSKAMVHQAETPQQQNGYDCGVHVLGAAKILSSHALSSSTRIESNSIQACDSPSRRLQRLEETLRNDMGNDSHDFCSKLRHEISSEIRRLHKKAKEKL